MLITLLIGNLNAGDRMKIMTICTIDVHARDVVAKMIVAKAPLGGPHISSQGGGGAAALFPGPLPVPNGASPRAGGGQGGRGGRGELTAGGGPAGGELPGLHVAVAAAPPLGR